jgi:HD-GYP domain-containing protein (c-di-GMP phosphodiesterase class II)
LEEHAAMKTKKRIRIDQLKPGMYVVGMDQPWYKTPYLLHHFLVQSQDTIDELVRNGVREVNIDPTKGLDVPEAGEPPASPPKNGGQAEPDAPARAEERPTNPGRVTRRDRELYQEAEVAVERVFEDLQGGRIPSVPALQSTVGGFFTRVLQDRTALMTQVLLQQMRRFDRSLAAHAVDTCILSLVFAAENGTDPHTMEEIGIGALLHDVGYVRLPRNLYRSRHQLAPHEEELMHQHPRLGKTMLANIAALPDLARRIVVEHHERIDGSGYPAGLSGPSLALAGQLVGLVDTYQSLITPRAGHLPLSPFQAIRHLFMLGEKRAFDKALVEVAVRCLGVYPIGSLVKLNTGERAIVVAVNPEHRLKPVLKVILDSQGEPYADPPLVDLASFEQRPDPCRTILTALDAGTEQINVAMYLDSTTEEQAA